MTEFKSKIEELKPAKELNFVSTPGFGIYKKFFPKEAVAHPAKMNCLLLEYLIENYTEGGKEIPVTESLIKSLDGVEWCECDE